MTERAGTTARKPAEVFLADDFVYAAASASADAAAGAIGETGGPVRDSFWRGLAARFGKRRGAVAAVWCVLFIVVMAVVGPLMNQYRFDQQITGHESMAPRAPGLERLGIFTGAETLRTSTGDVQVNRYAELPPDERAVTYYWFGSDALGRDLFTRTWEGVRISLFIAFVAVLVDIVFGVTYGFVSGYFGGRVDLVMQRIVEILNGIPTLVIVTLLILALRPGLLSVCLTIILTGWIGMARMARAQMLKVKDREYVLAARALGAGHLSLIFREIFPNVFGQLLIMSMFSIPNAIFMEAFLAFVGIGVPLPLASLGSLIADAFRSLTSHPYMLAFPVAILAALMLSFNLVADALRDALDPALKDF